MCTAICNVTDAGDVPAAMGIIPVWLYHKDNPNNKICVYALLDNASGGQGRSQKKIMTEAMSIVKFSS